MSASVSPAASASEKRNDDSQDKQQAEDVDEEDSEEEDAEYYKKLAKTYVGKYAKIEASGWKLGTCKVERIISSGDLVLASGKAEVGYVFVGSIAAGRKKDNLSWAVSNGNHVLVSADGSRSYTTFNGFLKAAGADRTGIVCPELLRPN